MTRERPGLLCRTLFCGSHLHASLVQIVRVTFNVCRLCFPVLDYQEGCRANWWEQDCQVKSTRETSTLSRLQIGDLGYCLICCLIYSFTIQRWKRLCRVVYPYIRFLRFMASLSRVCYVFQEFGASLRVWVDRLRAMYGMHDSLPQRMHSMVKAASHLLGFLARALTMISFAAS